MTSNTDNKNEVITQEASVVLVAESTVEACLDLGHSFLYRLRHPLRGLIVVLDSAVGNGAVMQC